MALSLDMVEPLHLAESRFLQVLLRQFTVTRYGGRAELRVYFDDQTPAICQAKAKAELLRAIPPGKRAAWQHRFDEFLLEGKGTDCDFEGDPDFVFRYASGGTLPIVQYRGADYFVFFFRDIYPIGWNLANGSCDRRDELLDPFIAVERELREELLVADFVNETRYIFLGDQGKPLDRPEFAVARAFWRNKHPTKDLSTLREQVIEVEWIDGPDSLSVAIGERKNRIERCFLNINGDDFGIEIDRVARIKVSDDAVFCDGELEGTQLVNSPVAFFEVERFHKLLKAGPPFLPDIFFYDTKRFEGPEIAHIVNGPFIAALEPVRTEEEIEAFRNAEEKFSLCPVTWRLARRYLEMTPLPPLPKRDRIFISYSHADKQWLNDLMMHLGPLVSADRLSIWVDTQIESGRPWLPEICNALDGAGVAVLLVTPAYLDSQFVRDQELARLLEAHQERGLPLLWIPIKASNYETTGLREIQAMIDPRLTIAEMKSQRRTRVWVDICKRIAEVVKKR